MRGAVVFDLDGTLIDSAPSLHRAAAATLRDMSLPEPDLATVTSFIGEGMTVLMERCLRWAGAPPDPSAADRFRALYEADPVSGTTLLPHAREALAALQADDHALGLCTNKPEAPARALLSAFDLGPFAAVAGGDTLPARKPDPAPLLHVVAALGIAPDAAVYVGDSRTDWRTAAAAGIRYVHLRGGYETEAPPDAWREVDGLDEVADLLRP
jgi:phosphoglycolate phosphatase